VDVLAGIGLIWLISELRKNRGWRTIAAFVIPIIVFYLGIFRVIDTSKQFTQDSRDRLKQWLVDNLKPGERVAAENYAGYAIGMSRRQQQDDPKPGVSLESDRFGALFGSIDEMKSDGFTHVVICEFAYERFFWPRPGTPEAEEVSYYRDWYETLARQAELVWDAVPSHDLHAMTNPRIRIYRLRK
jgi:hypothetical protein